jgi:ABC-type multidrug transport system ATPase subunit
MELSHLHEMICADALVKRFPGPLGEPIRAVDGLSFSVREGEIYGLLGPNGAGKTTTLRMLSGLLTPTSGVAYIAGTSLQDYPLLGKANIGFLTAQTGLYQRLSVRELLGYFGRLYGLNDPRLTDRVQELVELIEMGSFADIRCGALSTGQRQRASIARTLIHDPPILILDEPTLGLDVLSNRVILGFIRRQREEGKTILLSTHYLDEAETMCDRIGFLHRGGLLAEGTLDDLRRLAGRERLSEIFLELIRDDSPVATR